MKDFSRYFTPSLTPEDRRLIGQALGLEGAPWSMEESCGGQLLRRWTGEAGPCWSKPAEGDTALDLGTLGHHLPVHPFLESQPLWRDLLPFPFRALPPDSSDAILLGEAWNEAEGRLASFELSLVWIGPAETGIPLLFHYVRRRCVRLGTTDSLKEIGLRCLQGDWESAELQAHFGTRTGFFHWKTEVLRGSPLERLTSVFRGSEPLHGGDHHAPQPQSGL